MKDCRSLESFILGALINAADMHKECCHTEVEWAPFYAKVITAQLKPVLCAIQATPVAHVQAHFVDYPSNAAYGAAYASSRRK
jgi:hypothetical protein